MELFQDDFVFTEDAHKIKHKTTIEDRLLELRESNERIVQKLDKCYRQLREKDFKDIDLKLDIFLGKKPDPELKLKNRIGVLEYALYLNVENQHILKRQLKDVKQKEAG
ncbi:hypothetical protein SAMN02910357_00069 [Succinivibrio dextrinosolvens]|uniref:hypothetical protein n=1 Tax=Succinivibrio dextrinosolvens TaxID=83771 RepID=UPI0008EC334D|nr:hypothetical protein [Succinivibrio dextrinosolvens]SFS31814.1 hypothetical protein SAMN02910357_00069 [Succinivibrio dextrinosolvens]